MKTMICDGCGNTDLIYQDGAYLCEYCGRKYFPQSNSAESVISNNTALEQLIEKGNAYLKLEDYYSAAMTFSKITSEYPQKIIGYERYAVAITKNFSDNSNASTIIDEQEKIKNIASLDIDTTVNIENFIEKSDAYIKWCKHSIDYIDKKTKYDKSLADLKDVEKRIKETTKALEHSKKHRWNKLLIFEGAILLISLIKCIVTASDEWLLDFFNTFLILNLAGCLFLIAFILLLVADLITASENSEKLKKDTECVRRIQRNLPQHEKELSIAKANAMESRKKLDILLEN